jgi:hypothetical protein
MRLQQDAVFRRATLQPFGEAPLVDEVDCAGRLPAVGNEKGCKVGHSALLAAGSIRRER